MIKDQSHKPEGIFALPAIKTPSGVVVSQTPAICHVLGHELGLAPADAAADAKALQICCDAVDFITEATKPDFGSDRKQKWLTHFAAVTSADAPVNYGDFLLFTALELAISSFTAAVDESELPDGLGAWWNKMLKTKAVGLSVPSMGRPPNISRRRHRRAVFSHRSPRSRARGRSSCPASTTRPGKYHTLLRRGRKASSSRPGPPTAPRTRPPH